MKTWDIWVLAIHAAAYTVWFFDSKTIGAWRARRKFWKTAPAPRRSYELLETEAQKARKDALSKHPAGTRYSGMFATDSGTMARIAKESTRTRGSRSSWAYRPADSFWPIVKNEDYRD